MSWLSQGWHWVVGNPPVLGGAISGASTLVAAWLVTARLNRGMKRADFMLGFTKRFHDLVQNIHERNQKFRRAHAAENQMTPSDEEIADAHELYRQFFGLMFDEY